MESSDRRKPNGRKSKTFCCLSGKTQTSMTSVERRVLEVKNTDQYSVNTFKYVYFFGTIGTFYLRMLLQKQKM